MRWIVLIVGVALVAVAAFLLVQSGAPSGSPGPSSPSGGPSPRSPQIGSGSPGPSASPGPSPSPSPSPTPSPTPTPSPSPVPTPIVFESLDGYVMTFPPRWTVLPLQGQDVGPLLDLLGSQQPAIADLVRTYLDLSGASVSVIALDTDVEHVTGGLPPNANVLIQPTGGLPLSILAPVVSGVLGQLPGVEDPITRESVNLAAGPAVRFTSRVATSAPDGTDQTGVLTTYLLTRDSDAYLVTFVTSEDQVTRDGPVFGSIIDSFRFVD